VTTFTRAGTLELKAFAGDVRLLADTGAVIAG